MGRRHGDSGANAHAETTEHDAVHERRYRVVHGSVMLDHGVVAVVGETIALSDADADRMMADGIVQPAR